METNQTYTAEDLRNKSVTIKASVKFDIEHDTDWIDIIHERIGNDLFDKEQFLQFLLQNGYIELEDFIPSMEISIDKINND